MSAHTCTRNPQAQAPTPLLTLLTSSAASTRLPSLPTRPSKAKYNSSAPSSSSLCLTTHRPEASRTKDSSTTGWAGPCEPWPVEWRRASKRAAVASSVSGEGLPDQWDAEGDAEGKLCEVERGPCLMRSGWGKGLRAGDPD